MRTLVACLALGAGAAVLTTAGGAGPAAAAAAALLGSGVAGNLATELFKLGDRRVAERFLDGFHGIDENHDIARALRLAQLRALRAVLVRFDAARAGDRDRARQAAAQAFSAMLTHFLDADIGAAQSDKFGSAPGVAADEAAIRRAVVGVLADGFDVGLAAQRDAGRTPSVSETRRAVKAAVEAGALEEIRLRTIAVDGGPPALFLAAFRGDADNAGWFDLFVRDAADDLKAGGNFEKAWNAEQIALVKAIQAAQSEVLAAIKDDTGAIRDDTAALRAGQDRAEALLERLLRSQEQGVRAAAQEGVREREIIALARRIAADVQDFEQARRELERAVEVAIAVQREGRQGSNTGDFVDRVLKRVAELSGESRFDEAAEVAEVSFATWRAEDEERRQAAAQQGVTLARAGLNQHLLRRDAASAAAWVARIVDLETPDPAARFEALRRAQDAWYVRGRDKGLNLDLDVSIEIARLCLSLATSHDQRGAALNDLGVSLRTLGARESGTTRLEAAVAAFRAALQENTRERAPLQWAGTQDNLGAALSTLGERESGTARLEQAVAAFRAALEEFTRERAPLDWAATQMNLGNALRTLGERESGTARLEQAFAAYRAALEEFMREPAPLQWATTQNNLGNALLVLGTRESGTARLEQAVAAYRSALEERTRERAPLDWAGTHMNLGAALSTLGERESGTARLEQAVAAFRAALEEFTRERAPLDWAATQVNLGNALERLGERESGTARLEQAVAAFRAALEEFTRERAPLQWATTTGNLGVAMVTIAERTGDRAAAEAALAQIEAAHATMAASGHGPRASYYEGQRPRARALVAQLRGG